MPIFHNLLGHVFPFTPPEIDVYVADYKINTYIYCSYLLTYLHIFTNMIIPGTTEGRILLLSVTFSIVFTSISQSWSADDSSPVLSRSGKPVLSAGESSSLHRVKLKIRWPVNETTASIYIYTVSRNCARVAEAKRRLTSRRRRRRRRRVGTGRENCAQTANVD